MSDTVSLVKAPTLLPTGTSVEYRLGRRGQWSRATIRTVSTYSGIPLYALRVATGNGWEWAALRDVRAYR